MPPRYAYWTILIDSRPTAFRARVKEELLPTFNQLRRTNRDVVFKWFARGRLWDTPEQATWAAKHMPAQRDKRGRDWRPGGQHRDPRQRTFDQARNAGKADRRDKRRKRPPSTEPQPGKRSPTNRGETRASAPHAGGKPQGPAGPFRPSGRARRFAELPHGTAQSESSKQSENSRTQIKSRPQSKNFRPESEGRGPRPKNRKSPPHSPNLLSKADNLESQPESAKQPHSNEHAPEPPKHG